jgi:hypothetical protein
MKTNKTAGLPGDLEGGRRHFEQWRQRRKPHTPIPDSLWAEAVELAGKHGVSRTARTLRVGYYALKERVERTTAAAGDATAGEPTFLELAAGSLPGTGECQECLLEWEDASGAKMRVHLKGGERPDLVALIRSFWEGRQ